ncbi:MAG: Ig-like domain-containing protein, partial [Gaiellaceae bacterium]
VVTWACDNTAVASVSTKGLVRALSAGSAGITATCEGHSGSSAIAVTAPAFGGGSLAACPIFPADNIWNRDISALPVHPMSATWVSTLNSNPGLWVGFYPNSYGMKYVVTNSATPKVNIGITGQSASDSDVPGPYPFSAATPLEVGNPDAHAFMIDTSSCKLYEMYLADWNNGNPQAHAAVIWDLSSNALRADDHSSADEAGLALFPGLARWDEVQAGAIRHALRFEATEGHINGTQGAHLWPARHDSQTPNSNAPPMGARFRLKANYDISGYSAHTQVVLLALKHYGMFLSDVGLDWELVGTADPNWDTQMIQELFNVPASAFEAVDESGLMIDPNSMQSR